MRNTIFLKTFILLLIAITIISVKPVHSGATEPFSDVDSSFWAYKEIHYLQGKEIAEALQGDLFVPNEPITREKAARMLVKAKGLSINGDLPELPFEDVDKTHPDYPYIQVAFKEGLLQGKSADKFGLNEPLTRAQMAKIIAKAFHFTYMEPKAEERFIDIKNSNWAKEFVYTLSTIGVTTGINPHVFGPNNSVTRAQMAVFLYRAMTTTPFNQGDAYEIAAYDRYAIHPTNSNWNKHSRFSGPTAPNVKLLLNTRGYVQSEPVISRNGTIYFGSQDGCFYAVNSTGKLDWKYCFEPSEKMEINTAPILADNGQIYVLAHSFERGSTVLYGFHPLYQGPIWQIELPYSINNSQPILDKDGNIYIRTEGNILKIKPPQSDGGYTGKEIQWTWDESVLYESPDVDYPPVDLYNVTGAIGKSGKFYTANNNVLSKDGKFLYKLDGESTSFSDYTLHNDTLYFGTYSNMIQAYSLSSQPFTYQGGPFTYYDDTGSHEIYRKDIQMIKPKWAIELERIDGNRISASPVIGEDGAIYIGGESGILYGIYETDIGFPSTNAATIKVTNMIKQGNRTWRLPLNGWIKQIVQDNKGNLYIGTEKGMVYSISANGKINWQRKVSNSLIYSIVISKNNTLYVGSGYGIYQLKN